MTKGSGPGAKTGGQPPDDGQGSKNWHHGQLWLPGASEQKSQSWRGKSLSGSAQIKTWMFGACGSFVMSFIWFWEDLQGLNGLPQWLSGKESACNAGDSGDLGSIPGSGRSPQVGMATHLRWLSDKESACKAGDSGSIPGSGRYPAEGNDNPLQYPYLGNPMDRGTWGIMIQGVTRVTHDFVTKPPVFLPGKSHGERKLVDYSQWDRKELDMTEVTDQACRAWVN